MSRMFGRRKILESIGMISSPIRDIETIKQQLEIPTSQSNVRPNNTDGDDGDKKIVTENNQEFLYVKVDGRWMKSELQEVEI